jgi:hypothetical protein
MPTTSPSGSVKPGSTTLGRLFADMHRWPEDKRNGWEVVRELSKVCTVKEPPGIDPPPWFGKTVAEWVNWMAQHRPQGNYFSGVRTVERLGLVSLEHNDTYVLAMVSGLGDRHDGQVRITALREDAELRETLLWRVFEVEGGGEVIARPDRRAPHSSLELRLHAGRPARRLRRSGWVQPLRHRQSAWPTSPPRAGHVHLQHLAYPCDRPRRSLLGCRVLAAQWAYLLADQSPQTSSSRRNAGGRLRHSTASQRQEPQRFHGWEDIRAITSSADRRVRLLVTFRDERPSSGSGHGSSARQASRGAIRGANCRHLVIAVTV